MKLIFRLVLWLSSCAVLHAETPSSGPQVTRTLYLVRHGNYDSKSGDADGGHLTPLGIAQARLVAARLRGMPVKFSAVIYSTMTRAKETAEIIHRELPPHELEWSDLLRECTPPTWREDIMKGESPEELARAEKQLDAAFAEYFVPAKNSNEHDIIVCHGNVIRYFVTKALGVDTKSWLGFSFAHCSLTVIEVSRGGKFKILSAGDVGHIPPNLQSGVNAMSDAQLVVEQGK